MDKNHRGHCEGCKLTGGHPGQPIDKETAKHHAWYHAAPWLERGEYSTAEAVRAFIFEIHTRKTAAAVR